jgi:hypothetical protein
MRATPLGRPAKGAVCLTAAGEQGTRLVESCSRITTALAQLSLPQVPGRPGLIPAG